MTYTSCPICGAAMPADPHPTAASLAFVCPACYDEYGFMPIEEARKLDRTRRSIDYFKGLFQGSPLNPKDTSRFRKKRKERARELTRQREKQLKEHNIKRFIENRANERNK